MVSQAELILRVITLWFLVLPQFFTEGMGPFKKRNCVTDLSTEAIMHRKLDKLKRNKAPVVQAICGYTLNKLQQF